MSMTFTKSPGRSVTRGGGTMLAIVVALVALAASSSPASAAPVWVADLQHGPQHLPPSGLGQYRVQVFNLGDSDSVGTTTATLELPPGVRATSGAGDGWTCADTRWPASTVVCRYVSVVEAPKADLRGSNYVRGGAPTLVVTVLAEDTASGTHDARLTVSGGGAAASSVVDPTRIDPVPAGFGFALGGFAADAYDGELPGGAPERQAGGHPFELRVDFALNLTLENDTTTRPVTRYLAPDEHVHTLETKLPAGAIGNPQATPRCSGAELVGEAAIGDCPPDTQVGTIDLQMQNGRVTHSIPLSADIPVYNMVPPPGAVAALALAYSNVPAWIVVTLDPSDRYSVVATLQYATEEFVVSSARMALWGVPGDPAHDHLRFDRTTPRYGIPFTAPIKPYLRMPASCDEPGAVRARAFSWEHVGDFTPWQSGTAATMTGCDDPRFAFAPTIDVQPHETTANTPTGLDVEVAVPQKDDVVTDATDLYPQSGEDVAIPTPPLRDARVTLPPGMTVSPSSADGLGACTPLQIGLGTNAEPTCPDASKIGTVRIDTPLLPDPLKGSIHFAAQNDNPFGSLLAIYLVAKGPGVMIKLPGRVAPDPISGQLTTTFDENPPLPFSSLRLRFNGGPRAPLVTPPTCGVKTTTGVLTSWNAQLPPAAVSDAFTIDGGCGTRFDPGFAAGTERPVAGADSALVTRFSRTDADQELSTIDVSLPPGVLGRIADVPLCDDAAANAGTCGAGSLIGKSVVAAGPGSNPFYITNGRVYMTGPFKGAPFGLSIVVPAKAGPLDLGEVVVRAQVQVDRTTAALRVVSEPMPRILAGIPLHVRLVDVTVDRPGFTFNPTNCRELTSTARIGSTAGATSVKHARFQVDGCDRLRFNPRMGLRVGSKRRHTRRGSSTPLLARVRMPRGHANLKAVKVVLPAIVNARLGVVSRACTMDEFLADRCERARAGSAVAVTPLLAEPLRGGAYFVRNGKPLPDLMVGLRGQVDVDLAGRITIPGSKRLATNFNLVPDVPITSFTMRLVAGRKGPIGVARNLCRRQSSKARVRLVFRAQNGDLIRRAQPLRIRGCGKGKAGKRRTAKQKRGGARK